MHSFSKGYRGNEIVDIQVKLSALGYDLGPNGADGSFGDFTEESVKKFQHDRGLVQTGVVDVETWRVLVEATYKLGDRLLYLRSPFFRGDDVCELQVSLNNLGFNTGQVDGMYGQETERAVREFQLNYGLPSDGIFGPSTLTAIRNLRHLLSNKVSRIFPDPHRDQQSATSVFRGKRIAIDLDLQEPESQIVAGEIEISQDLGLRLGNLLELLGADVFYLQGPGLFSQDMAAEVYIGFRLNHSPDADVSGSTVLYRGAPDEFIEKSNALAKAVQNELVRSLESQNLDIGQSDFKLRTALPAPAVLVKPLFITNLVDQALLHQEVFRQKIAVAVFDGIKSYLQIS